MAEIEGVEMGVERREAVIEIVEEGMEIQGSNQMGGERDAPINIIDSASTEISEKKTSAETTAQEDQLPAFVQQKLDAVPGEPLEPHPIIIFRAPAWFHEADKFYYEPKMVSIGPYHHGKEKYQAMKEYKWSVLRDFLARNEEVSFNTYLRAITPLETQARRCYSESVSMASDEFVMMLTLDGCFIIEYFIKLRTGENNDPILFGASWAYMGIRTDILLLENQIPFFIIHKLFAIFWGSACYCTSHCALLELIYICIERIVHKKPTGTPQVSCRFIQHLLHLSHTCLVPNPQPPKESNHKKEGKIAKGLEKLKKEFIKRKPKKENGRMIMIPCVSELHGAGVKFRRKRNPRHSMDISFEDGIMEIPPMVIDTKQKIIFTNVAAFEQSQIIDVPQTFTSYLALMDALVNTKKDVAMLQKCGILENLLQNEEDAAMFFNHFGDFNMVNYYNHYFRGLFIKVRKYSDSTWYKYRAKLMNDYFNNPWAIISVVAGGVLMVFTGVQTFYTVYSVYHK